jgi:hypothetical protein
METELTPAEIKIVEESTKYRYGKGVAADSAAADAGGAHGLTIHLPKPIIPRW